MIHTKMIDNKLRNGQLSRRDWISSLTGGMGAVGLAGMLARKWRGLHPRQHPKPPAAPAPMKFPNFTAEGESEHRSVSPGRPITARYVRSEARAAEVSGPASVVRRLTHGTHDWGLASFDF